MSILHNLHLAELHLDRCVLRPSEALAVLEAVQHNVGLSALRISSEFVRLVCMSFCRVPFTSV
jgi:hypothetical protein